MRQDVAAVVQLDGARLQRLPRREQRWQLLVGDSNKGRRGCCDLLRRGHDGRDGVPDHAHAVASQHRFVLHEPAMPVDRHVLRGQHRLHTRQRQRLDCVNRQDPRVRVRAAHHLHVQHAVDEDVRSVHGAARDHVALAPALIERKFRRRHALAAHQRGRAVNRVEHSPVAGAPAVVRSEGLDDRRQNHIFQCRKLRQ